MASSSVLSRLIWRRAGLLGSRKLMISGSSRFCIKSSGDGRHRHEMSTMSGIGSETSSSPWLMLPPRMMTNYKAYDLKEKKLITLGGGESSNGNLYLKGSSHGWVALYDPVNLDLFLFNPLSRRHIMLPDVRTLPNIPKQQFKNSFGCVSKVIVSCSPDKEDECRAMITYDGSALAFCWPGRSKEWAPIGDLYCLDESGNKCARGYTDFVYSDRRKVFVCLSDVDEFETWDLRDPLLPRMVPLKTLMDFDDEEDDSAYDTEEEEKLRICCWWEEHIVLTPDDHLLLVTRYFMDPVGPDGVFVDSFDKSRKGCFSLTVDFGIQKYQPEDGDFKRVDGSDLGGLAIFVGRYSHSVALSTAEFPELKPNSIYFTDPFAAGSWKPEEEGDGRLFGGHDIGIFSYENKTVSPCYFPCDIPSIKRIAPAPFWFFPNPADF